MQKRQYENDALK
jgi:ubiquinone/menaquinone biosynthesis C-methylase UbiE